MSAYRMRILTKKDLQVNTCKSLIFKSGKRDSNSRPSAWEADALPTELLPPFKIVVQNYINISLFTIHFSLFTSTFAQAPEFPTTRIRS